jgi:hypothetical protein
MSSIRHYAMRLKRMVVNFSDNPSDNGGRYLNWITNHSGFICEQEDK